MARIRTIKPEFWVSETIGELSPNARLLFLCSLNQADDEGLLVWNPAICRSAAFTYDDITLADVEAIMAEIEGANLIVPYKDAQQKTFGWIPKFRKHQKIDRPQKAKHPIPSIQNPKIKEIYAERDDWVCHICGEIVEKNTNSNKEQGSLDHVNPRSKGGGDEPSNIRLAHFKCNASKKDRPMIDENSANIQRENSVGREGKGREQGREQEKEKEYRFRGRVIKLTNTDYVCWEKSYSSLDLDAELQALDDYYFGQGVKPSSAFSRCSSALAKKHRENQQVKNRSVADEFM